MTITPATVRDALALPPTGAAARRIPKDALVQHGAATTADRKLIDARVERLDWWATLSPATIGVAPADDAERPVAAIQLLALQARDEPIERLLTIVHRAIPVPVVLLTGLPAGGVRLSLAPLRRAERIDAVVLERLVVAPDLTGDATDAAFLTSLALPALPQTNLHALYEGLVWRVEALAAARVNGSAFRLPANAAAAEQRRMALAAHGAAQAAWVSAAAASRRETRLARRVELAAEAQRLKVRVGTLAGEVA